MTEEIEIRDRRNGQWAWINHAVLADLHLTTAEKVIYASLATFANCPEIRPSVPTIAQRSGTDNRTVQRALRKLTQVGYVRVDRLNDHSPSVYSLLKAAKGCLLCRDPRKDVTPGNLPPVTKTAGDPRQIVHETPGNLPPKYKKEKENIKPPTPKGVKEVKSVWDYYIEKLGKNPKILSLTSGRMSKGLSRFEEAKKKTGGDPDKAVQLMKLAVDALAASPHHMGKNEQGVRYDSWEKNLFPSLDKFEWWLERAP